MVAKDHLKLTLNTYAKCCPSNSSATFSKILVLTRLFEIQRSKGAI